MSENIIILLAASSIAMAASAFFSASETALFSIPRERIGGFQNHETQSRRLIHLLLTDVQRTLLLLLICNLFVNITLTGLIHSIVTSFLGKSDAFLSFIAAAAVIIVFGEVLPKNAALRWNEPLAAFAAPVLHSLKKLFSPLLDLLQRINRFFFERFQLHLHRPSPFITIDELKSAVRSSFERGIISKSEQGIITSLFDRGAQPVTRFMVHRLHVPLLPHYTTVADALKELVRFNRTYALITRNPRAQEITGVVCLPDLLGASPTDRCRQIAKPPQWVPATLETADLISFMFAKKQRVVCVLDEFGGLSGVFSLEDSLNRVMCFKPEYNAGDSVKTFSGLQEVDAMADWLPKSLADEVQNVRTLNGLLTRHLGRIPKKGENFEIDGRKIYIIDSGPSRIELVQIRKRE